MRARPRGLPAGARRPRPPDLLRDEGELEPGGAAVVRRAGLRLRHRLRRRARAGAGGRRRAGAGRLLRRRQDPRRDGRGRSTPASSASTSRAIGELESLSAVAAAGGRTARVSLRVNPDVDARTHPYISTGLRGNKFGIAHTEALAAYRRAAAPARASRSSASTATSARRSPRVAPYLDALDRLLDLVEALEAEGIAISHSTSAAASASPTPTRRRPMPSELIRGLLARIDARGHGHRKLLFEPGRSLVGNAGVLVSEVLYLKPGDEQELLHRRRGDERPDAAGDVRRLDARSSSASAGKASRRCSTSSARSASRATGSAATASLAVRPGATSSPSSPPAPMR